MWTQPEINDYKERREDNPLLVDLYKRANLSIDNPNDIAKYLSESVLELTMSDNDMFMTMAKELGRPEALINLEAMVLGSHNMAVLYLSQSIPVPIKINAPILTSHPDYNPQN